MGNLLDYRTAVVDTLATQLAEFKTVQAHAGVFGAAALKRLSARTPAALVALIQAKTVHRDNSGHMIGPVLSTVYVVGTDPKKEAPWSPALDLAERVADVIELNQFGLAYAAAARVKDLDVLYNNEIDSMGLCLAAVSFLQEVQWGRDRNAEDEAALYEDWTDPATVAAGWPAQLIGRSHNLGVAAPIEPLVWLRLMGNVNPPPLDPEAPRPDPEPIDEDI